MYNPLLLILVILIIITALLLCYSLYNSTIIGAGESKNEDLKQCSVDIIRLVGGTEKIVSLRVLNKIMPYLKEVGDSKPIEEYLLKQFKYQSSREELRNLASRDELAPKKYKMLHTIISEIINDNNIYSAEEFFRRSRLTYREFLPNEYRRIFDEYVKRAVPVKEDIKKISKIYDKYLSEEGTYLIKSKLLDRTEELIRTSSEYKFKHGRLDLTPAKLKAMAVSDPKKVFELDYVGMLSAMQEQAEALSPKKATDYGHRFVDDDLRRQLERDIETLRLLRDYPSTLARQREREEIVRRLELAAARLYTPSYARKLLQDLYYDYPLGYDYTRRREAERETSDERAKRIEAERQRDVARSAQVAADRAVAEGLQRDEENARKEQQRAVERAEELAKIKELEKLNKEQMHRMDEKESRDVEEVLQQGNIPAELEEIWKMGSKEEKNYESRNYESRNYESRNYESRNYESKDNMEVAMIPLN